jgi:hypothetical protein
MITLQKHEITNPTNIDKWQFGFRGFFPISDNIIFIPNVYEQVTFWIG